MKVLAVLLALLAGTVGKATYYNPGLMEQVREYRISIGQIERCRDCVDYVALLDCDRIGDRVWLQHPKGEVVGPLQVVDCAGRDDAPGLRRRQWVVDVSYRLGQHWKMRGPLAGVAVLAAPPTRPEPGKPHRPIVPVVDDTERRIGPLRGR